MNELWGFQPDDTDLAARKPKTLLGIHVRSSSRMQERYWHFFVEALFEWEQTMISKPDRIEPDVLSFVSFKLGMCFWTTTFLLVDDIHSEFIMANASFF